MVNHLIHWSLEHRALIVALAFLTFFFGIVTIRQMPVDVFPDFVPPQVIVQADVPGMTTAEVEALVTWPLEQALNGTSHLKNLRSQTFAGITSITATFDWGTDIYAARQLVTERLAMANERLPKDVVPALLPIASPIGIIVSVGVEGDRVTPMDLRTTAEWTVRPRLLAVPGVASVTVFGGDTKQFQVFVDPEKLRAYDLTLNDVFAAVQRANVNSGAGFLTNADQEYQIRGIGRIHNVEELANSVIAIRNGVPVAVSNVATVKIGAAFKRGDGGIDGKPYVVLEIRKQPGADTIGTTDAVDRALDELDRSMPAGIRLNRNLVRQSNFIHLAVHNVDRALLEGGIIVTIILFLFLLNFRTAFISFLAMPLALILGLISIRLFGSGINVMTLGGLAIAIGEVVDDAIIDVENVFRRLRENRALGNPRAALDVVYHASLEIRSSVVYATFIVVLVFFPVFMLSGIEGRIFAPLGIVYIMSILASLLIALTLTPALCSLLLPNAKLMERPESPVTVKMKYVYSRLLEKTLPRPGGVVAVSVVLLLGSLALLPFMGRAFLPTFNEGNWIVSIRALPGISLAESDRICKQIQEILLRHPEVISTAQRTGRAELNEEESQGVYFSEIDVNVKPSAQSAGLIDQIRKELDSIPGVNISVNQFISERIEELTSGARAAVVIKVFGPDLNILEAKGKEVTRIMASTPGTVDLYAEPVLGGPQLSVQIDRDAALRVGLTMGDVTDFLQLALSGRVASTVPDAQRLFDIFVRVDPGDVATLDRIRNLQISTPARGKIPLYEIARFEFVAAPDAINHENASRRLAVQANVEGRDVVSYVNDVRAKIDAQIQMPPGYYVDYGGDYENQVRSQHEILIYSLIALVGIFLLLQLAVKSLPLAGLILANLPLALIGGIVALYFSGGIISVAALIGFISLFGIATRNGIMLVAHYQYLEREGKPLEDVVRQGSLDRLIPILMTALTAGLALAPLAFSRGVSGRELQQPLAVVILGGLLTSTFLNMIVVPTLYRAYRRKAR
ncbi:MAG: efflux RND transporter permease subunit [Acidobacteriia bacterium]|nr:efflux RND transporter permease subunit [Terriglobia bacterium]